MTERGPGDWATMRGRAAGSSQQAAGWAVTRHLGSPDFSFHLPLPDPRPSDTVVTRQTSTLEDKMDAPPTLPPMESSPRVDRRVRRREERDRRREWLMGLCRRQQAADPPSHELASASQSVQGGGEDCTRATWGENVKELNVKEMWNG